MPILASANTAPDNNSDLWLTIRSYDGGQNHCGLVYRKSDTEIHILHLASHHDLRDEEFDTKYRWVDVGLDEHNQMVMAGFALAIADAMPELPYGFNAEGIAIDPSTGVLIDAPTGSGMTCATFVRAIFLYQGIKILQLETWEERHEDELWRNQILDIFEQNGVDQLHVDAVRTCNAAPRCKPEEVVAAGTADQNLYPVDFQYAEKIAQEILNDLNAA